jgi:hypothetical protein
METIAGEDIESVGNIVKQEKRDYRYSIKNVDALRTVMSSCINQLRRNEIDVDRGMAIIEASKIMLEILKAKKGE